MVRKLTDAVLSLALIILLVSCASSRYASAVVMAGHPAHAVHSIITSMTHHPSPIYLTPLNR